MLCFIWLRFQVPAIYMQSYFAAKSKRSIATLAEGLSSGGLVAGET